MKRYFLMMSIFILGSCNSVSVPDGYRMKRYKAPVPSYVSGAQTVNAAEVVTLKKDGAILIDVIGSGNNLTKKVDGTWLVVNPHTSIADTLWLPDVGRGALNSDQEQYFLKAMQEITANNLTQAAVFFCKENCWMSWNAAKRAASYGYRNLYWFPEGTEGWKKAGNNLEKVEPYILK